MCQKPNCPNCEFNNLLVVIEELRKELYSKAGHRKSLLDPEVIELSQKLDLSLNSFYRLTVNSSQK